jgi:hypothetical protein
MRCQLATDEGEKMMLETITEPPYGWWPNHPDEFAQAKNERTDADTLTELDVIDPDENDVVVWVRCEDCDDAGPLEDMQRQYDSGAWLCWDCDSRQRREWDEQVQYLDSIRWS